MDMKILFLDIDGVIQIFTQYRFDHTVEEVHALCRELTARFGGEFDYDAWAGREGSNPFWTVAAVQWDWNEDAVRELKRVLDATGAKIVLSSSWRDFGFEAMKALFRIWGLDSYYFDDTVKEYFWDWRQLNGDGAKKAVLKRCEECLPGDDFLDMRAMEIREWLDRHPEVTAYAAVDDMHLMRGLEGHFVHSRRGLKAEVADALIAALEKEDGPYPLPAEIRSMPELEVIRKAQAAYLAARAAGEPYGR